MVISPDLPGVIAPGSGILNGSSILLSLPVFLFSISIVRYSRSYLSGNAASVLSISATVPQGGKRKKVSQRFPSTIWQRTQI